LARAAAMHELVAEAALHAQEAVRDGVVARRGDLDDAVLLHVQPHLAAHAAVGADGIDLLLLRLAPAPLLPHHVLGAAHQGAGGADGHAVAAVNAGRVAQGHVEAGVDVRLEAAPGHGDGEGVLHVVPAGLDALVAQDALRIVADVQPVVIVAHRLLHRGAAGEAVWLRAVARGVLPERRRGAGVDRRLQELQDHATRVAHARRVGEDLHAVLGFARTRRHQHARALELHHTDAADVDGRQRGIVAQRGRVDAQRSEGAQDGRARGHCDLPAVNGQRDLVKHRYLLPAAGTL